MRILQIFNLDFKIKITLYSTKTIFKFITESANAPPKKYSYKTISNLKTQPNGNYSKCG